ncbi:hypothetical protein KDX20_06525 [Burkholderia cenocepacia]|uniref:hypothetical protein n=1 Tax=Burkholderia cenocepacia TaxID=95486 RepID=UPI001B9C36A6|nr:hypothetical protein [Burkholderia cenocepacia]MBR8154097.1 hypothetical protein [Burkholderia cenocepacia]
MSKIRTMLIGAALTAFATSAAFAQTGTTAQGAAGAGVQAQTPAAGAGAGVQGGAGANASGNAAGGATDAVGVAADGAKDTTSSAVHSTKKHTKHAAKLAKSHAGSAKAKADEATEGGASVGAQGGASAQGATQ